MRNLSNHYYASTSYKRAIPKLLLMCLLVLAVISQNVFVRAEETIRRLEDEEDTNDPNNDIIDGADSDPNADESNSAGNTQVPVATKQSIKVEEGAVAEVKKKARTKINVHQDEYNEFELEDMMARYKRGEYQISIRSIMPKGGPITGKTRVLARFDNLNPFVNAYSSPKCKFGDNKMIVDAMYVKCTKKELDFYALEKHEIRDSTCIQCEKSPVKDYAEVISFTVSLTGNFDDAASSMPFRYYNKLQVHNIYPRYGPKDGDTLVKVWGENFIDLGDDFRCNFGTKSKKAHYVNSTYLECRAASSDVVERGMPFSVSLNRQQNSLERISYWYYNMQSLFKVEPDYGSVAGDTKVTIRGQNFKPFDWASDIDNQNDTFCSFGPLGKTPAQVISQTEAECLSPPNAQKISNVPFKLTINNQNYTDEEKIFTFFNPPSVVDVGPLVGPVKGGTVVNFYGSAFDKKKITCSFGIYNVTGKFISKSQIQCVAPNYLEPGLVKLKISYDKDRFTSDTFNFKYYADPVITSITNACGPIDGYTQFDIIGKNFEEQGVGFAKCIFNNTIHMNATVLHSKAVVCDSPPLESTNGDMWYNISVTLDGISIATSQNKFKYYHQPQLLSISPSLGPLEGGTNSLIRGKGFNQTNICNFVVRVGCSNMPVTLINDTAFNVTSFPSKLPGAVVVSVSGNNQNFINDITLHFRDKENTFEYYQPFFVEWITPDLSSNSGNSQIKVRSIHFDQFKYDNDTNKIVRIKCRFVEDSEEAKLIGTEHYMTRIDDNIQICTSPKTEYLGNARLELSANGQQWQNTNQKVKFYNGPKVTSVNPTYGVTKNPKSLNMLVAGDNFDCQDCSKIKVRFTNDKGDRIYQDGTKVGSNIQTMIPKYPAPETLTVDISMNGQDYTNDNVTYGFMDPYVLQVTPRLYSPKGTTIATLHGYGFVQMDDTKSQVTYMNQDKQMMCNNGTDKCTNVYQVVDEHTVKVKVPEQVTTTVDGKTIDYQAPFNIAMMDMDGEFAKNGINLYYYHEFTFKNISAQFAYSNEEKPVMIETDFFWNKGNNYNMFRQNGNFTCRFTATTIEPPTQVVVPAYMESTPIGAYLPQKLPNQIRCRTPQWNSTDVVTLEISANGLDYMGNFQITFVENLKVLKLSPLAGPIEGGSKVKFYGYGYTASIPKDKEVYVKFGTAESIRMDKSNVNEQDKWSNEEYHNEMNIPKGILMTAEANDITIEEEVGLRSYFGALTPDISKTYSKSSPDYRNMGGPVYVQLSESVPILSTVHTQTAPSVQSSTKRLLVSSSDVYTENIETTYPDSSNLEFYFYRTPFVKKIEPNIGLATGGTLISITGGWFQYLPEYGVVPFCRIGNTVIRAIFVQTNRMLCKTPPSIETAIPAPIAISMNGVDFHETNFTFSYYEKPILIDVQPRSGKAEGGTNIKLQGQKFSKISQDMKTVRCRFRQVLNETSDDVDEENVPTKYTPAHWISKTEMKCGSPVGWRAGEKVKVDLTFNGVDYTDNSYDFYLYTIFQSFPKSGPADATGQYIQVKGSGFRTHFAISCQLDDVSVPPLHVKLNLIKCPMHAPNRPENQFNTVKFQILIDGIGHDLGNFHYYKQIEIDSVNPLIGPNEGMANIYFTGKHFRNDFENAKLGCRIGNTLAFATLVDGETIKCTISKKIPLVDEGQSLPVSVSLNSYSWAGSEYTFQPYGIISIYPTSGPVNDNTNINVVGKGFNNDLQEFARCRFGTEDNYQIVEAQVLDDEHLICKSPSDSLQLPDGASNEISIPFGIAFQEDMYFPYTGGTNKFRLYNHPVTIDIEPNESSVSRLTEVYIYADENEGFRQPVPAPGKNFIEQDQYGPKCKFGRFGTSPATYINQTTILCLTPTIQEDPSDISEENVIVSVAMNGVDFNEDISRCNFTFLGTGGGMSTWVIIMGSLVFGLLIVSILIFVSGLQAWWKNRRSQEHAPYVEQVQTGHFQPRSNSRASANPQVRGAPSAADRMRSRAGGASRQSGYNMGGSRMQGVSRGSGVGSQANNRFNQNNANGLN